MQAILLDADLKEVSKIEIKDIQEIYLGYEKKEDGNYYKIIGDLRCISDLDKIKEEQEEKERKEREEKYKTNQITPTRKEYPIKKTHNGSSANYDIYIIYSTQIKFTLKEFNTWLRSSHISICKEKIVYNWVSVEKTTPIHLLNEVGMCNRIVINKKENIIMCYPDSYSDHPKLTLHDFIIFENDNAKITAEDTKNSKET